MLKEIMNNILRQRSAYLKIKSDELFKKIDSNEKVRQEEMKKERETKEKRSMDIFRR